MSVAGFLAHGYMDKVEARLIADIVKSGSTFFKSPSLEYAGADEGTTLRYDGERDRFVLRRYEVGDSELHFYGFDETLILDEKELMDLLTGKTHPVPAWFEIRESNNYRFDFDPPPRATKTRAERIREIMDIRDCAYLKCEACKNHRVEPLHYSSSVNIGGANRYVHLEVSCLDCGHRTVYDFDD